MKFLNTYKIFESKNEIDAICKKYDIEDYTINDDGSIDVYENVELQQSLFGKIPLKFNRVNGDFNLNENLLESLEGCPKYIRGQFYCEVNKLTSLKYCPNYIGGDFVCIQNHIKDFNYFPEFIGGQFFCGKNPVYQLWTLFKDKDKIELFNDYDIIRDGGNSIVLDRLNAFLKEIGNNTVKKVIGYNNI